ncbi:MAG: glycosyltransferase [Treponema sp.]|nr:glycosyltransferase [Treponema sp.]
MNTTSSPFLSIITVNRNNAEGLRHTMQSVFNLTFKDFEYIIIDGASTDNSVQVIKEFLAVPEYAEKITFWCSEPDKGIYNAMNKGLQYVNGLLVNMMNSGDCFISDSLEKLPLWYKENPHSVLHGAISKYDDGVFVGAEGQPSIKIDTTPLCHQASFIPMELHKKFGGYDEQYRIYADFELWNRFKKNNVQFYWINHIICDFEGGGLSSIINKKRWQEKDAIMKKYGTYHRNPLKEFIKNFIPYGILKLLQNRHSFQ